MLCIWLLNLTVMYAIAPAVGLTEPSNNMSSGTVGLLAVTSVIAFGAAWLASCTLDSPTYAVCVGFIAPCLVGAGLGLVEYHFELENFKLVLSDSSDLRKLAMAELEHPGIKWVRPGILTGLFLMVVFWVVIAPLLGAFGFIIPPPDLSSIPEELWWMFGISGLLSPRT